MTDHRQGKPNPPQNLVITLNVVSLAGSTCAKATLARNGFSFWREGGTVTTTTVAETGGRSKGIT